jgi:3,4-dihydroxy 2-butanone 4-phosphate synthase/GTP cyclohydrolase II
MIEDGNRWDERSPEIVREIAVHLPTHLGDFDLVAYRAPGTELLHLALVKGAWSPEDAVLVRVHSSCLTGDVLGSCRCDCGEQLHKAMEMVEKEGKGVILYLNQEGRGIGLLNKLRAYQLQEQGLDTVDANLQLGFHADERDYTFAAAMLKDLGISNIRLMTNNPRKGESLSQLGHTVTEMMPLEVESNPFNAQYLQTKKEKMGHVLRFLHP